MLICVKFSNKLKKPFFPNFGGKKDFPGKFSFVMYNFKWDSSTMPKKLMTEFQENTDGQAERLKDGRKDGQTDLIL